MLSDVIERLGSKEDRTAAESKLLAGALRQTGDAADRATAKAVLADAAIRRLGDAEQDAAKRSDGLQKSLGNLKMNPGLAGPALALLPALGTLTGVVAGLGAGLAGAFVAGGAAVAAFGAVAKPVLSDAKTAATAVEKAQNNYAIAIANGTKQSVAYKAEQIAIAKAYAGMSPAQIALSRQLGDMAKSWDAVKTAQTPVVAGALQPWLRSVTDLTKQLGPIIAAVGPVIGKIGTQFNILINSSAFTTFRNFIARTGSAAVGAAGNLLTGFLDAMITLLPKFNPLIQQATGWLGGLGNSIARWANSQKTADQITAFMAWFKTNGPVVGGLLTNIGGALKALAPGLTSGGTTELKIISDFFGLIAKLPASFAKPITEVAGTLLILSKLGVLKVGVQIVGAAAKWLTGGLVNLGGGAAAGAEIRAAMVSGGAAAAAEIRAAMTGGGAAAGAEGAAGGAAGKGAAGGVAGAGAAAGAALGVVVAGAFAGALIRAVGDTLSPHGTFAGRLNQMFQGLSGPVSTSVLHAFTFGGLEGWLTAKIGIPVGRVMNNIADGARIWGVNIGRTVTGAWVTIEGGAKLWWGNIKTAVAGIWNTTWNNTVSRAAGGVRDVEKWFGNLRAGAALAWGQVRGDAVTAWNTIWANTVSRVATGVGNVMRFFTGLPGKILTALGNAGTTLLGWGKGVINGLLAGMTSVISAVWTFIKGIPGKILSFLGIKSPPQWAIDAGKHIMNGVGIGMAQAQGKLVKDTAQFSASALAGAVGGQGGPASASASQAQAYASSRLGAYGWGAAQMKPLILLWNQESGWNRLARNPSSGAYGIPQALPASKMGAEANPPTSSAAAQINWGLSYIRGRYGSPAGAWAHEVAFNWYGGGLDAMFTRPTLIGVGERGPEHVQVTPGGGGDLGGKLDRLSAQVAELIRTTAAVPAATGRHVAAGVNGASADAVFRGRYPGR